MGPKAKDIDRLKQEESLILVEINEQVESLRMYSKRSSEGEDDDEEY